MKIYLSVDNITFRITDNDNNVCLSVDSPRYVFEANIATLIPAVKAMIESIESDTLRHALADIANMKAEIDADAKDESEWVEWGSVDTPRVGIPIHLDAHDMVEVQLRRDILVGTGLVHTWNWTVDPGHKHPGDIMRYRVIG